MRALSPVATPLPAPAAFPDPETVLVGIPVFNEEAHIVPCLRSLLAGSPAMRRVRIVVADGGSSDRTRAIVESLLPGFANLMLIENPDRLQSAAINRIVADCGGPQHRILVRCDAHALYPPNYVLRAAASLVAHDAAAVATPMDAYGRSAFARAAAWVVDTPLGSGGAAHRGGRRSGWVDHGHHAAVRLDWFRRIGGYDTGFSHNEDAELDHRLRRAGGRIWLDAEIRLDYAMRESPQALARQYWTYGRGRGRTFRKHRTWPKARQIIPAINLLGIAFAVASAPIDPRTLAWPAAYLGVLVGASVLAAARLRDPAGLWAGPVAATMHMAWGAGLLSTFVSHARARTRTSDSATPGSATPLPPGLKRAP